MSVEVIGDGPEKVCEESKKDSKTLGLSTLKRVAKSGLNGKHWNDKVSLGGVRRRSGGICYPKKSYLELNLQSCFQKTILLLCFQIFPFRGTNCRILNLKLDFQIKEMFVRIFFQGY